MKEYFRKTKLRRFCSLLCCVLLFCSALGIPQAWGDGERALLDEASQSAAIDSENFPDEAFRTYVSSLDRNQDGNLSAEERSAVTKISVSEKDIASLKGIEWFTSVTELDCSLNRLTELDVHALALLEKLNCSGNDLLTLDVSANGNLAELNCQSNRLTSLDLSGNTNLGTSSSATRTEGNLRYVNARVLNGSICLSELTSTGFDPAKACNFHLADSNVMCSIDPATCTVSGLPVDCGTAEIYYTYQTGYAPVTCEFRLSAVAHTVDYVQAKPATYTQDGNVEYWQCRNCRRCFTDASCAGTGVDVSGMIIARCSITVPDVGPGETAYVDGDAVQADSSGKLWLPPEECRVVTVVTWNDAQAEAHSRYPVGLKVYMLSFAQGAYTVRPMEALDNVLQYAGSSIRITGKKGIRMITGVPTAVKEQLTGTGIDGYTLLEYGTLVQWDEVLNGEEPTLETAEIKSNYAYKKDVADPVFDVKNGSTRYTNVLVGFSMEQCSPDLAMRAYMKLQAPDGSTVVIYGGTVHRSIGYIALQNRNAFARGTDAYAYIWEIIHAVYGTEYDAK